MCGLISPCSYPSLQLQCATTNLAISRKPSGFIVAFAVRVSCRHRLLIHQKELSALKLRQTTTAQKCAPFEHAKGVQTDASAPKRRLSFKLLQTGTSAPGTAPFLQTAEKELGQGLGPTSAMEGYTL
jgi:hypothetical protein